MTKVNKKLVFEEQDLIFFYIEDSIYCEKIKKNVILE